jgi:hypothetical protein
VRRAAWLAPWFRDTWLAEHVFAGVDIVRNKEDGEIRTYINRLHAEGRLKEPCRRELLFTGPPALEAFFPTGDAASAACLVETAVLRDRALDELALTGPDTALKALVASIEANKEWQTAWNVVRALKEGGTMPVYVVDSVDPMLFPRSRAIEDWLARFVRALPTEYGGDTLPVIRDNKIILSDRRARQMVESAEDHADVFRGVCTFIADSNPNYCFHSVAELLTPKQRVDAANSTVEAASDDADPDDSDLEDTVDEARVAATSGGGCDAASTGKRNLDAADLDAIAHSTNNFLLNQIKELKRTRNV